MAKYMNDDEPYTVHAVGVDMDEPTAKLLASKHKDLDKDDIEILEMYSITEVDNFNITLTEGE